MRRTSSTTGRASGGTLWDSIGGESPVRRGTILTGTAFCETALKLNSEIAVSSTANKAHAHAGTKPRRSSPRISDLKAAPDSCACDGHHRRPVVQAEEPCGIPSEVNRR